MVEQLSLQVLREHVEMLVGAEVFRVFIGRSKLVHWCGWS